jgi:RND family efflux transporter MFP subunit
VYDKEVVERFMRRGPLTVLVPREMLRLQVRPPGGATLEAAGRVRGRKAIMTASAVPSITTQVPGPRTRPGPRPPWRPLGALVVGLTLAVATACGGAPEAGGAGGGPGGGRPAMPVEIVTLAPRPVEQLGEFVGTVKSRHAATIQPQAEGFITRIHVKSGDRVAQGAPILDLDAASQRSVVASLQSLRAAREADATFARQQAQRQKTLLDLGAASQQDYDQAEARLKDAEAQLAAVDDQIRQQQNELAYYHVVAPTAGFVGDVPVHVGDSVTKSTVVTTIDANAGLEVYVGVPVQLAPRLALGLPVRLVTDTGDVIATTMVSFISSSVDDATQTVLVKAPVPATTALRTDQFVHAEVVWSTEPSLTIPVVSVIRINGQMFAFVAAPGEGGGLVAHQQPITVGPVIGSDYLVTGGLAAGDRLITSGLQKIGEGAPVEAAPAAAAGGGADREVP